MHDLDTQRRAKPYRVTLTFVLDNPADNMCEGQRNKAPGSTYSWHSDFVTSSAALQHIQNALDGYWDTSSEFVSNVDSVRWGKRRNSRLEGVSTFRQRIEGRSRPTTDHYTALAS